MKTFFKFSALTLLSLIIALGIISYRQFTTPTTAEMEHHFSEHQLILEQTTEQILTAISHRSAVPSRNNAQKAYQWFEIHPAPEMYRGGDSINIHYYTHVKGIGVGAFGTGIAYLDDSKQKNIYPTLETMADDKKSVEGFIGYKHITGQWYSFLWEAD